MSSHVPGADTPPWAQNEPPLLGREDELRHQAAALSDLRDGRGRWLAIAGEPGIGKTRLAAELARRAREEGLGVLHGHGVEFEERVPFGMLVEALEPRLSALDQSRIEGLRPDALAELAQVFPVLSDHRDELRTGLRSERWRLYSAIEALLHELTRDAPTVLVLDDVHWADEASLEVVAHLLGRPLDMPLLPVLLYRRGQAPPVLSTAIATAEREGHASRIEPRTLREPEAQRLLGADLPPDVRSALFHESGGNPFYLLELARVHPQRAATLAPEVASQGVSDAVPAAVRAAIAGELARLSSAARSLAYAAAVVGDAFAPRVAAEVAGLSERSAFAAIDELASRGLVGEAHEPGQFTFRHPIVRSAVYHSDTPTGRVRAHARAARTLETRGARPSALAHHVERSATAGDPKAIGTLAAAGDEVALRAPAVAAHWYDTALTLTGEEDAGTRLRLLLPLGASLMAIGRIEESRQALEQVLRALPRESTTEHATVLGMIAGLEHLLGRHEEARGLLQSALAAVPDGPSPETATLELELAIDHWYRREWDLVIERGRRAAAQSSSVGHVPLQTEAAALMALAESYSGGTLAAREALAEAERLVARLSDGELAARVRALLFLGMAAEALERFSHAARWSERGMSIARATGQEFWFVALGAVVAHTGGWTGPLGESVRHAESARRAAIVLGNDQALLWPAITLCWLETLRGELPAARRAGEEAAAAARRTPSAMLGYLGHFQLAEASIRAGDVEQGVAAILEHGGGTELPGAEPAWRGYWFGVLAEAELARGDTAAADRWVSQAERAVASLRLAGREGMTMRVRAEVLLAQGEPLRAAEHAAGAVERLQSVGQRVDAARAQALAGRALLAAGRDDEAVRELERAHATLTTCGAAGHADDAARLLGRRGRRVRTPAGHLDALSPREREVAQLVAHGLTNRAIADELFVSLRTVESHLSRVFTKLGTSSRAGVAREVQRAATDATA